MPAKHEPGSISANSVRDETSRRASVRRSRPIVSRTNQWSLVREQRRVDREHGRGVALGLQHPGADVELVGAQRAGSRRRARAPSQRPPGGAGGLDAGDVGRLRAARRLDRERRGAPRAVDRDVDVLDSGARRRRSLRSSGVSATPLRVGRAVARARRARARAPARAAANCAGFAIVVDEAPVLRALAAHAFAGGAEDVGEVVAHLALVGERA